VEELSPNPYTGKVLTDKPLRADARRNHEQLLLAARDVFIERGPSAPLDEIARRAGVGIATLYRRFPDRQALMRAVVIAALDHTRDVADAALAEERSAFDALIRYLHAAVDIRVSAVIPALLDALDMEDAALVRARESSASAMQRIVDLAHDEGKLAADIGFGDIGTLLVRLSHPLPGGIDAAFDRELAHRHVDIAVYGLRPSRRRRPGKPVTRQQLRSRAGRR
jgi:AcrR family transcriptional regulator